MSSISMTIKILLLADDAPELLQRIATMERHGEHWEADNVEIYNILAIWTAGGNGKTYVDSSNSNVMAEGHG